MSNKRDRKSKGANLAHLTTDADGNEASGAKLVAEYVGAALIAGATVNGISKKYTGKGIWGNIRDVGEKSRRFLSGEKESMNEPTNHQNGKNPKESSQKITKHDKTPSINDYLTGNYNKKSAQTKSWYKEISTPWLKAKVCLTHLQTGEKACYGADTATDMHA